MQGEGTRFERGYRRLGRHYVGVVLCVFGAFVMGVVIPGYTGFFLIPIFDLSFGRWLELTVPWWVFYGTLVPPVTALIVRRRFRGLSAWADGERSTQTAERTWREAVVELPGTIVRVLVWCAVVEVGPVLWVGRELGLGASEHVVYYLVVLALIGLVGVLAYLLFEQGIRPIVREVAAYLGPGFLWSEGTSLSMKVAAIVPAISFFTAMVVGALGRASESAEAFMWSLLALTLLTSLTLALGLTLMLRRSVLDRLIELQAAMRRVDEGDLGARVDPLAGDELDELGRSFNRMVESLRGSQARIVTASDEARRQVERDLHDGAQQQLVLLRLQLGMLGRRAAGDPPLEAAVAELRASLDTALEELRRLAHGLYPAALESGGLVPALDEAMRRAGVAGALDADGVERLAPETERAVYFCCLEALQNAAKHAGDATVRIALAHAEGRLDFSVSDDGPGFAGNGTPGGGLRNMADRIGALGGALAVDTAPGRGTTVRGSVPAA